MEFLELAKRRCSIRAYQDKPVEQDKLDAILEAARVAPSACNLQPIYLIVVQGQEAHAKLGKAARLYGAPLAIIVCADSEAAWERSLDGMRSTGIDASIATDHMMLEAADLGLGSVWICAFDPQIVRNEFSLPENIAPINLLAIGYPEGPLKSPERHGAERKPLADIASFELA